ncbi:hypothetical protein VPH35_077019 [Triticum aestivum]
MFLNLIPPSLIKHMSLLDLIIVLILKFVGSAAASWQDGHKVAVASRHTKATNRISTKKPVRIAAASLASAMDQPLYLHPLRQALSQIKRKGMIKPNNNMAFPCRKRMMLSASMMIADLLNHFLSLTM